MKNLFITLAFFVTFFSFSQQSKIDSLKIEFQNATDETEIITIQQQLFQQYLATKNAIDIHQYLDTLLTTKKIKSNTNLIALTYKLKGSLYGRENKCDLSIQEFKKGLQFIKNIETNKIAGDLYLNISACFRLKSELDSVLFFSKKAEEIYLKINNYRGLCFYHYNMSGFYIDMDNYSSSEYHLNKLLFYNKFYKNTFFDGQSYYLMGGFNFFYLKNIDIAEINFEKALSHFRKGQFNKEIVQTLFSLGTINTDKNNFKKAKKYFEEALLTFNNSSNLTVSKTLINHLLNYVEYLIKVKKNDEAQKQLNYASLLDKKHGFKFNKQYIRISQAKIYIANGNYKGAAIELEKIIERGLTTEIRFHFYQTKIKLLKKTNNPKLLNLFFEKYIALNDSLNEVNLKKNIVYNERKLGTEEKEKENLKLKADNAEQVLNLETEKNNKLILGTGILSLSLLSLVFWRKYKSEKKAKRIIIIQKDAIVEQKEVIETLQKDLHHRVKNNLAIINRFIDVIKEEFNDKAFDTKLVELQNRIASINEVHQQLYNNKDAAKLGVKKYIEKLTQNIENTFVNENITVEQNIDTIVNLKADKSFPIGLIVNEFLTNSFKYAFTDTEKGKISINIYESNNLYNLELSDNGKGFPKGFDAENSKTFGLRIMKLLTQQINGTFKISSSNGVKLNIQFPK